MTKEKVHGCQSLHMFEISLNIILRLLYVSFQTWTQLVFLTAKLQVY